MPPTPALVGASGTPSSDDASQPPSIDNSATLEIVPLYNEYSVTTPLPPSQTFSAPSPLASTSHPGLEMVRTTLQFVGAASLAVCKAIDVAIELEHEERQALKELRKGVESLKSDTTAYKVLLNAMENDTDLDSFIQRCVWGCAQAHMLTEQTIYNITDRVE